MEENQTASAEAMHVTDKMWLALASIITAIAAFLRFWQLELKPFHHDEGVNGFFLTNLFKDGIYKYDPANYHGPTLYYIALPFAKFFGLETIPVRVSVAIFGVLTVILALYLKRWIGRSGSLFAALFIALSPGMVYISRYFIHEIFFVFLSLAMVIAVLLFIEKQKAGPAAIGWTILLLFVCFLPSALTLASYLAGSSPGALWAFRVAFLIIDAIMVYFVMKAALSWDQGRPLYLMLASACVALFFATKETAFITLGTMVLACLSVWIWRGIRESELAEKNFVRVIVAPHVFVVAAALYFRSSIADAFGWLSTTFLSAPGKTPEPFVFYSIILLLVVSAVAWVIFLIDVKSDNVSDLVEPAEAKWQTFRSGLGNSTQTLIIAAAAGGVFIYLSVLFFSSFFTYAEGIGKAFEAYAIWTKTGNKDHTQNGVFAYLKWGMRVESPILIAGALGALIALIKSKHRVAMFIAFWAFGLFAAYTIIPYKTPWLALSYLLPMCLIAGYGLGEMISSRNNLLKVGAAAIALSGSMLLAYQTYQHNFVRYDDDEMTYVYAHTRRGFLDLMNKVEYYAAKSGKGKDATIEIVSPDYWPMTWYTYGYEHANYHGTVVDASTAEMIIAKKTDQDAAMIQKYALHYKFAGVYPLRPGVNLVLLVRRDLADSDAQDVYKVLEYRSVPGYTQ